MSYVPAEFVVAWRCPACQQVVSTAIHSESGPWVTERCPSCNVVAERKGMLPADLSAFHDARKKALQHHAKQHLTVFVDSSPSGVA